MIRIEDKKIYVLFLVLLLLAGCKSKKTDIGMSEVEMSGMAVVASSPSAVSPCTSLSGNVKLSVNVDGKPISAKGSMRVKESEGVQIGITALGLVEIASLEFFPESARLIFKLGKQYTDVSYSDVTFMQKTGVDYRLLESVLMNRLFSPDGRPFLQALKDMSFADAGTYVTVTTEPYKGILYRFYVDKATGYLVQSEGIRENGDAVTCSYDNFGDIDGVPFPHTIALVFNGAGEHVELEFALSRVSLDEFVFNARRIPSSYDRLAPEQMLKSIVNK